MSFERKKLPKNILSIPVDNVSFHFEESLANKKIVFHKNLTRERKLYVNADKRNEIMNSLTMFNY